MADFVNYNNASIEQDLICDTNTPGLMCCDDKKKLDGIAEGANKYVHPDTHSANIITENINRRFVSDTEKNTWNSKANGTHDHTSISGNANTASFAYEADRADIATTANHADDAVALTSSAGSATQPVYFSGGKPVACTYTLAKSVPSNAKFTDTTYSLSSFGITATAAELNKLDGCTATVTELNYVDGVTSNIQTQLNAKAASSHSHSVATTSANGFMAASDKTKLNSIPKITSGSTLPTSGSEGDIFFLEGATKEYVLPTAGLNTLGGVKTTSSVTSTSGLTACPIISGVPYYYYKNNIPDACKEIGDWNSATTNGYYMGAGASNAPTTGTVWYFGRTVVHNANYLFQEAWQFTASSNANLVPKYIRSRNNGTWGSWIRTNHTTSLYSGSLTTGSITFNRDNYDLFIISAKVSTSSAQCNITIPKEAITTSDTEYQVTDETNYLTFKLRYSGSTVTLTYGTKKATGAAILYVYGSN